MDGYSTVRKLRNLLSEGSDSSWLDVKTSYDYIYEAIVATVGRVNLLTTTDTLTTVASTTDYTLNYNFLKLYMMDSQNRYFVKYYNGTSYYFIYHKPYDSMYLANNTTDVSIPDSFSIMDATPLSRITGTATSTSAISNGEATLTDTAGNFSNAEPGDLIHNTTDTSHGVIISKTSSTVLITVLYDATDNFWTSGDAYIIVPAHRYRLILDPPPSTAGHTVTVPYVFKPDPVYSATIATGYRGYPIPDDYEPGIIKYAAWLYKYRDREPQYGDAFYKYWEDDLRKKAKGSNDALRRKGFRVNFLKSASQSGSSR